MSSLTQNQRSVLLVILAESGRVDRVVPKWFDSIGRTEQSLINRGLVDVVEQQNERTLLRLTQAGIKAA